MKITKRLLKLQKRTKWSWERMCREMHRVNGEEGPSHTTLFRYANAKVARPNKLTLRWIERAIDGIESELMKKEI
ncbi:MAG: hypothetical protein KAJ55_03380 [Anaerolineales bacterium]|nr:hypothetical protein [Anaerolineales bacterium]